jgi:hypothetical protein
MSLSQTTPLLQANSHSSSQYECHRDSKYFTANKSKYLSVSLLFLLLGMIFYFYYFASSVHTNSVGNSVHYLYTRNDTTLIDRISDNFHQISRDHKGGLFIGSGMSPSPTTMSKSKKSNALPTPNPASRPEPGPPRRAEKIA